MICKSIHKFWTNGNQKPCTLFYRGYNELIFQDLLEWQTKCESFNENISLQIATSCNMCGLLVPANTTRVMDSSSIPCHKVLRRHCKLVIAISPSPDQVANHTLYPWFSVFCNPLEMPQPHTKLLHEYGGLIPDIPGCVFQVFLQIFPILFSWNFKEKKLHQHILHLPQSC